ncbi:MAG: peptidylprolyl isomerase [Candidatus Cloacimonetes bacterium]|nr:peptidylprolyl isomerase [Candidatus Cloacimonadota bacterium]MCF7814021.1 peptidylprolyl isomerase [Candidatus Cloacimonadota bacterium]MCF7868075.1 peptidylprolyl isomerase [Candidatus Cloacimonadota bacterium]MCF7883498.1 peptidylprolyl isomerase [Candidatus Cloacimonadota bacterium]
MLEGMRRNASWIIIIIAALFILSMAIGGISSIFTKNPYKYVGIIEGEKITFSQYQEMLKATYASHAEQNPEAEFDDQLTNQLNEQTWNQLKQRILFNKEIKKRRVKVSEDDVIAALQDPPDDVKEIEQMQTDGEFDQDKYTDMLLENQQFAAYMENRVRGMLPYEKLYEDVKSEVVLTEEELQKEYIKENDKAEADIIYFDSSLIPEVDITDEDMQEYYDENKEEYKRGPARKLKYVRMDLAASEADKKAAKEKIDSLYVVVSEGADFAEIARKYSQDSSAPKGGDLGYFEEGRMVPEFSAAAFSMDIGQISEPVETQYGWHIIKTTGKKQSPEGKPMVQASHILIKFEPSFETRANQEILVDDLFENAEKVGLEKAAEELAYEVKETREFYEDAQYIPGLGKDEGQVEFAFKHKEGTLLDPFNIGEDSYVLAEISYVVGDHYMPFEDVESSIKRKVEQEKKVEKLYEMAEKFIAENDVANYIKAAKSQDIKVVEAKDIIAEKAIPSIRKDDILNETILEHEAGETTDLIKGEFGAYIAIVKSRTKPDMEKFEAEKEELYETKLEEKKEEYLNQWYRELLENAEITDNRSLFFD